VEKKHVGNFKVRGGLRTGGGEDKILIDGIKKGGLFEQFQGRRA